MQIRSIAVVLALALLAVGGVTAVRELTKPAPPMRVAPIVIDPQAGAGTPEPDRAAQRRERREARERRAERARERQRERKRREARERPIEPAPASPPAPQPAPPPPTGNDVGDEDGGDD